MQKFYFLPFVFFLSACGSYLNYIGNSKTPTSKVDVYVSDESINQPYEIMGKGYLYSTALNRRLQERMQQLAIKKAKAVGADAVLFQDYVIVTPANSASIIIVDSTRNAAIRKSAGTSNTVTKDFAILFLKYKSK